MSFLAPFLLVALPIAALPIVIHLLNQRRYQTVNWGAMQFLLTANKMSRGVARIRSWLILLFRTLAILGLIFAVSRPLASGWLSAAGGSKADTTIVVVDRSPSMAQSDSRTASSKLESGVTKLADTVALVGSSKWVLIDSATKEPANLRDAADLKRTMAASPTSASADLPTLIESAHQYIKDNNCGQTNIWILSDLRENDWKAGSGKWQSIREAFQLFPQQINFHLLAYPELAEDNVSVRVTDVRRRPGVDKKGGAVVLSVRLNSSKEKGKNVVPLKFDVDGAISELTVEWEGPTYELRDHQIPIESDAKQGWAHVSIPADVNPADNDFYFVYSDTSIRRAAIVCEDPKLAEVLKITAATSFESATPNPVEVTTPDGISTIVWDDLSLLLWQAPLPTEGAATIIDSFVQAGGRVIFMPPTTPGKDSYRGISWTEWQERQAPVDVTRWRGETDLLANSESGVALPVGDVKVKRTCGIQGDVVALASLRDNAPVLARLSGENKGVYLLTTTPLPKDSSLLEEGVVLYSLVQRALFDGASSRTQAMGMDAGNIDAELAVDWQKVAGPDDVRSDQYAYVGGVYESEKRLTAVNRNSNEDVAPVLTDVAVDKLFDGLRFDRINDQAGNFEALAKEVWKLFLVVMMFALFIEAILCLPKARPAVEVKL